MPIEVTAYIPNIAPGAYQAVCTDVQEKAAKDDPSNIFRVWEFTLGDGTGRTVRASSSLATTPKSKGGKWITALIGHTPRVGESVEPIGRPCTIIVAIKDTTGYEYVETVAPATGPAVVSPVRPLVEAPTTEDDPLPF